jgi:hypothetical protein
MATSNTITPRRLRDSRGRFVKAPKAPQAVTEAQKAPEIVKAPAKEVVEVPDLRVEDLLVHHGYHHIPLKEYKKLLKGYSKETLRQAIGVMVTLGVRLPEALALSKSDIYRPWMVGQLKVILDHPGLIEVLEWTLNSEFTTWNQGFAKFPRQGKGKVGPLAFLVEKLNSLRKEGKTSIATIKYLAEAAKLLGWIK